MWQIQEPFMIKILSWVGIDRHFSLIMGIFKSPQLASWLMVKDWISPPKSGIRQGYLLLPFLFKIVLQVLVRKIRQ